MRFTVVPTADPEVRKLLRQLGEPITLFGEKEVTAPECPLASQGMRSKRQTKTAVAPLCSILASAWPGMLAAVCGLLVRMDHSSLQAHV
jgi:hypothetical protein